MSVFAAAAAEARATGSSIEDALEKVANDRRSARLSLLIDERVAQLEQLPESDLIARCERQGFNALVSREAMIGALARHEINNEEQARVLLAEFGCP